MLCWLGLEEEEGGACESRPEEVQSCRLGLFLGRMVSVWFEPDGVSRFLIASASEYGAMPSKYALCQFDQTLSFFSIRRFDDVCCSQNEEVVR